MEWLKALLPLIQTGLRMYVGGQLVKKTSESAKSVALKSSVLGFGIMTMLLFLLASIVMTFVDLGSQFETHEGVHFSGMMVSALCLSLIGMFVFLVCLMATKFIAAREREKKELEQPKKTGEPFLIFAEQFLEALIKNISEKPSSSQQSSHHSPHG
ncbi:MAG: hypothetical protein JST80_13235 [Bdellovibrionales bacterium]|nr:hypothetical protein [Bdellovibrionales bacterium]